MALSTKIHILHTPTMCYVYHCSYGSYYVNRSLTLLCNFFVIFKLFQIDGCIHSVDWTTGLSYFPFLHKFLCLFLESSLHFYNLRTSTWLLWMIIIMTIVSCLLQCFQQYINLKLCSSHLINNKLYSYLSPPGA